MKTLKTFEQFTQVDEAFLGIKNKEEKIEQTKMQMKALLKYFITKNSVRNYKYWFNHIFNKSLYDMREKIEIYFNKLTGTSDPHGFGNGTNKIAGFGREIADTIKKNHNVYDKELSQKISEISPKLNLDPKVICDKLGLTCNAQA